LQFTIGLGQIIYGLEQAVIGMNQGESKTFEVSPEQAYGQSDDSLIQVMDRKKFPEAINPEIGLEFQIQQTDGVTKVWKVTDISESSITLDANNPLAGKELIFDVQLVEIIEPNNTKAAKYYRLGVEAQDKGHIDEAISFYKKALELNPNLTEAYYNIGVALHRKGDFDKSAEFYLIAIGYNPAFPEAHHNLGMVFKEKGQTDEAISCYEKAIEIRPDYADAYYNLGNAFVSKGEFDEAIQSYKKTIDIAPDHAEAHWNIALINLLLGNFEKGWKGYEWRWKLKDIIVKRDFSQPLWDGTDIKDRTILLHAEQGFGDTIQFIRYAPLVAQRGAKVIVECQKELVRLLKNVVGIHRIIAHGEELPDFDIHCPILSLPGIFGTDLTNIPAKIPYIHADLSLIKKWHDTIASNNSEYHVGLVWSGDPSFKDFHLKSCSLKSFAPLAQAANITFYSLQKGDASEQARNVPEGIKLIDYTDKIHDFSDTAAIIKNLDLIISIDTDVAHLGGALGKPVWTLLPFIPDWRWMLNRNDSPWYPTMKLFRQTSRGDWQLVIEKVKKALEQYSINLGTSK
jgi:FKBP-type peptidyl-prolyl cis-trans isomerase 2